MKYITVLYLLLPKKPLCIIRINPIFKILIVINNNGFVPELNLEIVSRKSHLISICWFFA